jgi:DNA polymerase-3 subunit epsilon
MPHAQKLRNDASTTLRRRVWVLFSLAGLAVTGVIAASLLLALRTIGPQAAAALLLYGGGAIFVLVLLLALAWQAVDEKLARPVLQWARLLQVVAASADAHPSPSDRPSLAWLNPLDAALHDVAEALHRARTEQDAQLAAATQAASRRQLQLEAVLRDLNVGVVVCNAGHDVLLYNQQALQMLQAPITLGLGRPLQDSLDLDPVRQALDLLDAWQGEPDARHGPSEPIAELRLQTQHGTPSALDARLSRVRDLEARPAGYVLTLTPAATPAAPRTEAPIQAPRISAATPMSARPDFYDFDLFSQPVSPVQAGSLLRNLPFVVFDTETTGLEPSNGDRIVQIAGVRVLHGRALAGESFDQLVNPQRPIPARSTAIHGITEAMVADAPDITTVLPAFTAFTRGSVLVAHNAAFDLKFITLQQDRCGVNFDNPVLDTVLLSAFLFDPSAQHTLDALCARLNLEISDRHTALGDAQATAAVFTRMLDLLEARGVHTLADALAVSARMHAIRRSQARY